MTQFCAGMQEMQMLSIAVYITTLCESRCTCKGTGLCVHACRTTCSLLTNCVKAYDTWQTSGLFLQPAHGCIDIAIQTYVHAVAYQSFAALM